MTGLSPAERTRLLNELRDLRLRVSENRGILRALGRPKRRVRWRERAERAEAEVQRLRALADSNGRKPAVSDELLEAARAVVRAYTAEAEDWNDGEYALWQKDDLIVALVRLRQVLAGKRP